MTPDGLPKTPLVRRFLRDDAGAMVAEYALMLAIFCAGCGCALYFYGRAISKAFSDAADLLAAVSP